MKHDSNEIDEADSFEVLKNLPIGRLNKQVLLPLE